MPSFKFAARSLPPVPASGQIDYWDKSLPGFGMRVSAGGTRTWVVMYRYNGIKRRMKIGVFRGGTDPVTGSPEDARALGLADARDEARKVARAAEKGQDPATDRKNNRAAVNSVNELAEAYIEQYAKRKKRSWYKDDQILKADVLPVIGRKRTEDVTRADVRKVLDRVMAREAPIRANHTLEVIRKMFNWSIETRDSPTVNPAARLSKPGSSNSRGRWLKADELLQFWGALDTAKLGERAVAALMLLALTVQREMEVLRMRWPDLDLEEDLLWKIPADHAKNQIEHVIPLPTLAVQILRGLRKTAAKDAVYVFPAIKNPNTHVGRGFIEKRMGKIRKAVKIEHFTPHDLRRTATTYFGKLKVPQIIKKKILNHAKKKKSDVTEIYDRFEYIDEKRDALAKWEELLLVMVTPKNDSSNVVTMQRAAN